MLKAPLQALQRMLQHDAGRKAVRIALHSNKKTKIGSSMMDIILSHWVTHVYLAWALVVILGSWWSRSTPCHGNHSESEKIRKEQ